MTAVDPILCDGSESYQPPLPGTVGAVLPGEAFKVAPGGLGAVLEPFLALPPVRGARLAGLAWQQGRGARRLTDGELVRPEATIIGRHFGTGTSGDVIVDQHVRLTDGSGETAGEAQTSWLADRASLPAPDLATDEIGSPDWGAALAERLSADQAFASSASTFDGSIGVASRSGGNVTSVEVRIYRGAIIESGRKTLDGPTYVLEADALTWAELITGRYDNYVRIAAQGRFTIRGSGFQYLRLTKTTRLMIWHAREMRREARNG